MFQQNHPEYTTVAYHMYWPGGDPYWTYNSVDPLGRMAYYGLNWVPYLVIEGDNALNEGSEDVSDWEAAILEHISVSSAPLGISITGDLNYQGEGYVDIALNPETGVTGDYQLHVLLVEDGLYFMGSNGFPNHEGVMRHMFPESAGTSISLEDGVAHTETVAVEIPQDFVIENCRLVAFVQAADHTVVNAASYHLTELTPVNVPYLKLSSTELLVIDENGDGKLNPGEATNLSVSLFNECDWIEASGITGILSTTNPYVTITDSLGSYDPIAACQSGSNLTDSYAFSVSESAPVIYDMEFNLRLQANQDTEVPYETDFPVSVSMDMFQNHFPVTLSNGVVSGSAVVDLDGDGSLEVIFGGLDSLLHVIDVDGLELSGFPFSAGDKITSAPAVGDIDNDGDLDIVAVTTGGAIFAVQLDGSGELLTQAADNILGTPAIDDLDGDGDLEIVTAGFGYDLIAMHHDGTMLNGYPMIISGERMEGGPALADMNGDGSKDIIVGTKGDQLHVYDVNGNSLPGFPVDLDNDIKTAPVITDLTGNGDLEIITGQRSGVVYALSSAGDILWTHQLAAVPILSAPAVFDYNLDGLMETVYVLPDGRVGILDHAGNMLEGWPQTLASTCYSPPIMADIDGDDVPEIILGDDSNMLYVFHMDGTLLENFPLDLGARVHCAATVDDLDQDGNLELIVGTDASLSVVDILASSGRENSWYTSRGNYMRTGYFPNYLVGTDKPAGLPDHLTLEQNYPNPFNPSTSIKFGLPEKSTVVLTIYDVLGNEVNRLLEDELSAGQYALSWDGLDHLGSPAASGIYFTRIEAAGSEAVIKMMLLK